jgi:HemK-like putative methylase
LRTFDVNDNAVLDAFDTVPRETFVPKGREPFAYIDQTLNLAGANGEARCLPAPMVLARLIQALKIRPGASALDVGSGTGAIILSLAKETRGGGIFLGTDLSEDAIALAKENAKRCALEGKVNFAVADGLDDFDEPGVVDVIVSNPPYIESSVCETLDPRVRDWEPRMALDGGASGLEFYERYLADAFNLLRSGGAVFFEIGESQGPAVSRLMFEYGFEDIAVEKDYAGRDRYASARLP